MNEFQDLLDDKTVSIGIASLFAILNSWIAYHKGFYRYLTPEKPLKDKISLKCLFGAFAVFLVLQVVIAPTLILLYISISSGSLSDVSSAKIDVQIQGWFNVLAMVLASSGVITYTSLLDKRTKNLIWNRSIKKTGKTHVKCFFFGMATWLVCYPVVVAVGELLSVILYYLFQTPEIDQLAVRSLKMITDYPLLYFSTLSSMVLLVPIMEETLFRGYLQSWLRGMMGRTTAIAITSAIFALFHFSFSQGVSNIEYLVALFILSCYLGFVYERQRTLWASIGLHFFFNAISVLVITLS